MDEFQHPLIVCSHKLTLSSLEEFARQLATQGKLTIQIENEEGLKITFEHPKSVLSCKLRIYNLLVIPHLQYKLNFDEFELYMFDEFIEIKFNIKVDYSHFKDLYKREELRDLVYFHDLFEILKAFGATEIYFSIFAEFAKGKTLIYNWKNVFNEISGLEHFKLNL